VPGIVKAEWPGRGSHTGNGRRRSTPRRPRRAGAPLPRPRPPVRAEKAGRREPARSRPSRPKCPAAPPRLGPVLPAPSGPSPGSGAPAGRAPAASNGCRRRRGWFSVENRRDDARLLAAVERTLRCEHLVEHAPEREEVRSARPFFPSKLLRRHVGTVPSTVPDSSRRCVATVRQSPRRELAPSTGQAEVQQLDSARRHARRLSAA